MFYRLTGNSETKLERHEGIFTRSYQEARARYDARIRSWEIDFHDNLFFIKDSLGSIEVAYLEFGSYPIQNCSCSEFAEVGCGTCMHLEALRLLDQHKLPRVKVRPITFVTDGDQLHTLGRLNVWETPAVRPHVLMQAERELPYDNTKYPDVNVFKEFGIDLYDFQQTSIRMMLRNMRTVLILRMGLGKTLCALACCALLNKRRILIVCPNSLKYQWQREITRLQLGTSLVLSKGSDILEDTGQRFLIMSYEMLNFNRQLLDLEFDIVIPDEIQKIKNRESETWKTVSQIKAEYVFALSGTPIQNNISDLISLIDFLNPSEFKPTWKFYEDFCECTRAKVLGIRHDRLHAFKRRIARYLVNPVIDYDAFSLPTKEEVVVSTRLDPTQREIHDDFMDGAKILIAKGMETPLTPPEQIILNSLLTKARMAATDARLFRALQPGLEYHKSEKFENVESLLLRLTQKNKKVVVYSDWIKALDLLHPFLEEHQIGYVCFNSKANAKKRDVALMGFMKDPNIRVFLSTDTGGLGLDGLQLVSHDLIHLERVWNPMKMEQRNGRLIRTFQKNNKVNVYRFHTNAGVEGLISENNQRKYSVIANVLDKEEYESKNITA